MEVSQRQELVWLLPYVIRGTTTEGGLTGTHPSIRGWVSWSR